MPNLQYNLVYKKEIFLDCKIPFLDELNALHTAKMFQKDPVPMHESSFQVHTSGILFGRYTFEFPMVVYDNPDNAADPIITRLELFGPPSKTHAIFLMF